MRPITVRSRFVVGVVAAVVLLVSRGSDDAGDTTGGVEPSAGRAPVDAGAPAGALAAGFNEAGFDLLHTLPAEENVVFSPSSIGHALLMARAAADASTAAAIDAAFRLPETAHEAWNALDQRMADAQGEDLTVTVADRIWPREDVRPDPGWLELLAAYHGAGVEPLDLSGDPEGSRQRINDWVDEQTGGLIPELLPDGFIKDKTVLVLTDALYFTARWATPFGKTGPVHGRFTRLDGSTVEVEFMRELELADRRGAGDGFLAAEIPYVGNEFSMLVIVPDEGRFAELRDGLDQAFLDAIDATFTTGPYELLVPTWETTTRIDLLDWLQDTGAAPGQYPAISPGAYLGAAAHGANITVDEWGTVAAAATGLDFPVSKPPQPELVIAADTPFLYLIRHRHSGLVLFACQITDPTA